MKILNSMLKFSVSERLEFSGVIDDPLFENLGVMDNFRGSNFYISVYNFMIALKFLMDLCSSKITIVCLNGETRFCLTSN